MHISKTSVISSPVLRTFATIELDKSPFDSTFSFDMPMTSRGTSKTALSAVSSRERKIQRSKTIEVDQPLTHRRLVHYTWVEEMSKKKKPKTKSFSTLSTLTSNPLKKTIEPPSKEDLEKDSKP